MKKNLYTAYKDSYRYLYTAALAVCGNELAAEDVLLDAVTSLGVKASFEKALRTVKSLAVERAQDMAGVEFLEDTPLGDETAALRRAVMLKHGLKLRTRNIASVMGLPVSQVRSMLERASAVKGLEKLCERELKQGACAPDTASFRQALLARGAAERAPGRQRSISKTVMSIIMALLIGFMIWLGTALFDYYARAIVRTQTEVTDAGTDI